MIAALFVGIPAAVPAYAASPIDDKRAEAQHVFDQIQQLNQSLGRADERVNLADVRLAQVRDEQKVNRHELKVAKSNLSRSQAMIAERLVSLYKTPEPTTLEMILGSTSLGDMLTRIDNANRLSSLDGEVIGQVRTFKHDVEQHARRLKSEHAYARRLVAEREAQRRSIDDQLAERQRLLTSIKGEIVKLEAEQRARQLQAVRAAQAQIVAAQEAQQQATQTAVIGASASTPDGASVEPASPFGNQVVSIAMSFQGVPYVWGGSTPGGFDCSGLVMYAFAQLGVSLPHSSYAMWNYGVPVDPSQLEPGDLVFFDALGHVGLYIGGGEYVNAPYTGTVVQVTPLFSGWSAEHYSGARRIL